MSRSKNPMLPTIQEKDHESSSSTKNSNDENQSKQTWSQNHNTTFEQQCLTCIEKEAGLLKLQNKSKNLENKICKKTNCSSKPLEEQRKNCQRLNQDIKNFENKIDDMEKEHESRSEEISERNWEKQKNEQAGRTKLDLEQKIKQLENEQICVLQQRRDSKIETQLQNIQQELKTLKSQLLQEKQDHNKLKILHNRTESALTEIRQALNKLEKDFVKIKQQSLENEKELSKKYNNDVKKCNTKQISKENEKMRSENSSLKKQLNSSDIQILFSESSSGRKRLNEVPDSNTNPIITNKKFPSDTESMIRQYQKQIVELGCRISTMELQVKNNNSQQNELDSNIKNVRDLCDKLNEEKRRKQQDTFPNTSVLPQDNNQALNEEQIIDQDTLIKLEYLMKVVKEELVQHRLLNQELQKEVKRLDERIAFCVDRQPK